EAAVVSDEPREQTAARRLEDGIYDSLNELESPNFFLRMQINERSTQTPSGRRMRHFLRPGSQISIQMGRCRRGGSMQAKAGEFSLNRSRRVSPGAAGRAYDLWVSCPFGRRG